MGAVALEHGVNLAAQRQLHVGVIGGIFDKKAVLNRNATPLIDAGYLVASVDGGWHTGEKTRNKVARVQRFLDVWQPDVLIGLSAGGLLATVAGFDHPSVQRIVTAASPLHWPSFRENTPKLRAIEVAFPTLYGLKKIYDSQIRDRLGTTKQQFLHFRGTEDEIVPPGLSIMSGAHEGMSNIEHVVFPTPSRAERGKISAHTHNTRGVFHLPRLHEFVAGELAAVA